MVIVLGTIFPRYHESDPAATTHTTAVMQRRLVTTEPDPALKQAPSIYRRKDFWNPSRPPFRSKQSLHDGWARRSVIGTDARLNEAQGKLSFNLMAGAKAR
jgi:hypothetical protein